MGKHLRIFVVFVLLAGLLSTTVVQAQDVPTLFATAQTATQQMVNQIQSGTSATDLATARSFAQQAAASGQLAIAALQQVLPIAPDDATRSRAQGLIDHLTNAVKSAQLAATGPDAEVKSNLDAARGEAVEALAEFPAIGAPGSLPSAGGQVPAYLGLLVTGVGLLMVLAGMALKRSALGRA